MGGFQERGCRALMVLYGWVLGVGAFWLLEEMLCCVWTWTGLNRTCWGDVKICSGYKLKATTFASSRPTGVRFTFSLILSGMYVLSCILAWCR